MYTKMDILAVSFSVKSSHSHLSVSLKCQHLLGFEEEGWASAFMPPMLTISEYITVFSPVSWPTEMIGLLVYFKYSGTWSFLALSINKMNYLCFSYCMSVNKDLFIYLFLGFIEYRILNTGLGRHWGKADIFEYLLRARHWASHCKCVSISLHCLFVTVLYNYKRLWAYKSLRL